MKPVIIGIIGASSASPELLQAAYDVGAGIASRGWVLVTGGMGGVMEAASKGAHEAGGVVVGVLPTGRTSDANPHVTIPIATNMGHARNVIIAHTADAIVAIGGGHGTLSEIAIAQKLGKRVLGITTWEIDGVERKTGADEALATLKSAIG